MASTFKRYTTSSREAFTPKARDSEQPQATVTSSTRTHSNIRFGSDTEIHHRVISPPGTPESNPPTYSNDTRLNSNFSMGNAAPVTLSSSQAAFTPRDTTVSYDSLRSPKVYSAVTATKSVIHFGDAQPVGERFQSSHTQSFVDHGAVPKREASRTAREVNVTPIPDLTVKISTMKDHFTPPKTLSPVTPVPRSPVEVVTQVSAFSREAEPMPMSARKYQSIKLTTTGGISDVSNQERYMSSSKSTYVTHPLSPSHAAAQASAKKTSSHIVFGSDLGGR